MAVVILANSWMNNPVGFELNEAGTVVNVDVLRAMFSPAWWAEVSHMAVAAFEAVGFAFAAVYAFGMLRGRRASTTKSFFLGMLVVTLAAPLMIFSGDHTARYVAHEEPAKLAAIESHFRTEEGAGLSIGGWPDPETGEVYYDIKIPYLLSILSYDDPNAVVWGLEEWPEDERPSPYAVWWAYDISDRHRVLPRRRHTPVLARLLAQPRRPHREVLLSAVVFSGFLGFSPSSSAGSRPRKGDGGDGAQRPQSDRADQKDPGRPYLPQRFPVRLGYSKSSFDPASCSASRALRSCWTFSRRSRWSPGVVLSAPAPLATTCSRRS